MLTRRELFKAAGLALVSPTLIEILQPLIPPSSIAIAEAEVFTTLSFNELLRSQFPYELLREYYSKQDFLFERLAKDERDFVNGAQYDVAKPILVSWKVIC